VVAHGAGLRHHHAQAGAAQFQAEVDVLATVAVAGVEPAHPLEGLAVQEHAGPGDGQRLRACGLRRLLQMAELWSHRPPSPLARRQQLGSQSITLSVIH